MLEVESTGSAIESTIVDVHLFLSVTVTVNFPGERLVIVSFAEELLHE